MGGYFFFLLCLVTSIFLLAYGSTRLESLRVLLAALLALVSAAVLAGILKLAALMVVVRMSASQTLGPLESGSWRSDGAIIAVLCSVILCAIFIRIAFTKKPVEQFKNWARETLARWQQPLGIENKVCINRMRLVLFFVLCGMLFYSIFQAPCQALMLFGMWDKPEESQNCAMSALSPPVSLVLLGIVLGASFLKNNWMLGAVVSTFLAIATFERAADGFRNQIAIAEVNRGRKVWSEAMRGGEKAGEYELRVSEFSVYSTQERMPSCVYRAIFKGDVLKRQISNTCYQTFSMKDLFELVDSTIRVPRCGANGCVCDGRVVTSAEFDAELGYPKRIVQSFDRHFNIFYRIANFVPHVCTLLFDPPLEYEAVVVPRAPDSK